MKRTAMIAAALAATLAMGSAATVANAAALDSRAVRAAHGDDTNYRAARHNRDRDYDDRDYDDREYRRDRRENTRFFKYLILGVVQGILDYHLDRVSRDDDRDTRDRDYRDRRPDHPRILTERQVERRLEREGYTVRDLEYDADRGLYVARGRDPSGARVRLQIDPYTGKVLRARRAG